MAIKIYDWGAGNADQIAKAIPAAIQGMWDAEDRDLKRKALAAKLAADGDKKKYQKAELFGKLYDTMGGTAAAATIRSLESPGGLESYLQPKAQSGSPQEQAIEYGDPAEARNYPPATTVEAPYPSDQETKGYLSPGLLPGGGRLGKSQFEEDVGGFRSKKQRESQLLDLNIAKEERQASQEADKLEQDADKFHFAKGEVPRRDEQGNRVKHPDGDTIYDLTPDAIKKRDLENDKIIAATKKLNEAAKGGNSLKKLNDIFAVDYNTWTQGGFENATAALEKIKQVEDQLVNGKLKTGSTAAGVRDAFGKIVSFKDLEQAKALINKISLESIKAALGSQFTEKDRIAYEANNFDVNAKPKGNIERLRMLRSLVQGKINGMVNKSNYYEGNNMSLGGYKFTADDAFIATEPGKWHNTNPALNKPSDGKQKRKLGPGEIDGADLGF